MPCLSRQQSRGWLRSTVNRQPHGEDRPAWFRFDVNPPAMLVGDDLLNDVEAEAGAFALPLGGEECLENPRLQRRRNADAVVDHAHQRGAALARRLDSQDAAV